MTNYESPEYLGFLRTIFNYWAKYC